MQLNGVGKGQESLVEHAKLANATFNAMYWPVNRS